MKEILKDISKVVGSFVLVSISAVLYFIVIGYIWGKFPEVTSWNRFFMYSFVIDPIAIGNGVMLCSVPMILAAYWMTKYHRIWRIICALPLLPAGVFTSLIPWAMRPATSAGIAFSVITTIYIVAFYVTDIYMMIFYEDD